MLGAGPAEWWSKRCGHLRHQKKKKGPQILTNTVIYNKKIK